MIVVFVVEFFFLRTLLFLVGVLGRLLFLFWVIYYCSCYLGFFYVIGYDRKKFILKDRIININGFKNFLELDGMRERGWFDEFLVWVCFEFYNSEGNIVFVLVIKFGFLGFFREVIGWNFLWFIF